ncbi:hypothetical protein ANCDUO_03234 [Ancylostoma duodenale]|uniref:DUF255 domain-containing protein n=1 Tax=Ancylostoma duodenale TaxID=51022 RepID=A0A0C2GY59_9BILA|nr:hypothetical protein ANCDUO_03234 [Ancylostoma duodenale]
MTSKGATASCANSYFESSFYKAFTSEPDTSWVEGGACSVYTHGDAPPLDPVLTGAFKYKVSNFDEKYGGFGNAPKFPKACSVYAHGDAPSLDPVLTGAFKYKVSNFDEKYGGFGNAPKFPKACDLEFLIYHFCWTKIDSERELCRHMLDVTLDAMSRGGIHDHIGKGFHRYSVDEEWHVPHFEKMLYDQAQLLGIYAEASHVCGDKYKNVVEDIAQYMNDCLSHEEGGFYAAEDADSLPTPESTEKKEGAFCVWQRCQDPHGELQNQNVLRMKRSHDYYENRFGIPTDVLSEGINKAKATLARVRYQRPPPHLDSKMVTAWQGLSISGLSKVWRNYFYHIFSNELSVFKAAIALQRPAHVERAVKTVEFVKKHLMDENGHLLRAAYRGEDGSVQNTASPVYAFSDDYAFLIQGLLDLYQVKPDIEFLKLAERLQTDMDSKFWDTETESGYFIGSEQGDVKVRVMEDQDGAEPCANSVAVGNLIRLYDYFEDTECKRKAEKIVAASSSRLIKYPFILTKMISGYHRMVKGSTEDSKFWDMETESGYFIGSEQGDVKVRVMEDQDGAEPCANSVAVGNLIRLYDYFEDTECKRKAEKIVAASSSRLIKFVFLLFFWPARHLQISAGIRSF